ncbi:hypothetical protein L1281_001683 [Neisseria sp. HSC-16F19]|nr:hypothetical protein [Neisseria sp. HSC-16F19]MCP2041089.1 hypothetical protein [Neisseria sp. HSC-16F19]
MTNKILCCALLAALSAPAAAQSAWIPQTYVGTWAKTAAMCHSDYAAADKDLLHIRADGQLEYIGQEHGIELQFTLTGKSYSPLLGTAEGTVSAGGETLPQRMHIDYRVRGKRLYDRSQTTYSGLNNEGERPLQAQVKPVVRVRCP